MIEDQYHGTAQALKNVSKDAVITRQEFIENYPRAFTDDVTTKLFKKSDSVRMSDLMSFIHEEY